MTNRRVSLAILAALALSGFAVFKFAGPAVKPAGLFVSLMGLYVAPLALLGRVKIAEWLEPMWVRAVIAGISALVVVLSGEWASRTLNIAFGVQASNFPLAYLVLTLLYIPVKLAPLATIALFLIVLLSPVFVAVVFITAKRIKVVFVYLGWLLLASGYFGLIHGLSWIAVSRDVTIATALAIALDFDGRHHCTNIGDDRAVLVKLVGDGNILVADVERHVVVMTTCITALNGVTEAPADQSAPQ